MHKIHQLSLMYLASLQYSIFSIMDKQRFIGVALWAIIGYTVVYTESYLYKQPLIIPPTFVYTSQHHFITHKKLCEIVLQHLTSANNSKTMPGKKIQQALYQQSIYIRNAIVYRSIVGKITVLIQTKKPIARVIYDHIPGLYIDDTGTFLPLSSQYTARVLLISGVESKSLKKYIEDKKYFSKLYDLIQMINRHSWWKKQIVQLDIDTKGHIRMYTQISKQHILLGSLEKAKQKLHKLQACYTHILPYKGWNHYKNINLAFEQQVICQ